MHAVSSTPAWAMLAYLIAGVCFILALRGLSSPATSRKGNRYGMAGMALAVDSAVAGTEGPIARGNPHPRYRCNDLADYVARFALPPYIESLQGASRPDALVH